jgi:hypothetical protein
VQPVHSDLDLVNDPLQLVNVYHGAPRRGGSERPALAGASESSSHTMQMVFLKLLESLKVIHDFDQVKRMSQLTNLVA